MQLLWIRHGQMIFRDDAAADLETLNRLFNAELQAGLSVRGRREAAAVATHLRRHPVDAIYASELERARETAEVSADALGLRVTVREGISELRPGRLKPQSLGGRYIQALQGLPLVPDRTRNHLLGATLIPLYFSSWYAGRTVGGETRSGLCARFEAIFEELRATHPPTARVALFAHGYLIFFLSGWLTRPGLTRRLVWRSPHVANGAITEMELPPSGPPRLVSYASKSHL